MVSYNVGGDRMETKLKDKQRLLADKPDSVSRTRVAREVPNLVSDDIARLQQIFPQVFAEGKIDLEKLRATLGDVVETRPERFGWLHLRAVPLSSACSSHSSSPKESPRAVPA